MTDVYINSDNIISPLGDTAEANFTQLAKNASGIRLHENVAMSDVPFYASLMPDNYFTRDRLSYTKFEQLLIASITNALKNSEVDVTDKNTILIIASTKGNISLLESADPDFKRRISLRTSASLIASHFGFVHTPIVISSACVSGLSALLTGMRLIQSGVCQHVVVTGADVISKFVLSGFQSFQAISPEPCRPFDKNRKGLNLGEGAASIILSSKYNKGIKIAGGATTNDANHISAPSRTGEELALAINKALQQAQLLSTDINFISAHGTATLYNDEMEAKAITQAGMASVPVNSLKGYYGHTLGAAGLIESVIAIQSLKAQIVLPTKGFNEHGVSTPLNIQKESQFITAKHCLKTASGFGGCNAAMIFSK